VRSRVVKMGFPVPWREWAAKDLYAAMHDIITSRAARERGIYRTQAILRDFESYRRGERDCSDRMFNTIGFELWAGMDSRTAP
jgi:hypothetical protein